jgi:hypothetical protein
MGMSATALRLLTGIDRETGQDQKSIPYSKSETVLVLVAAVTFTGALIHVGAAVDHYREFPLYTLVFCLLAAGQTAWAAMLLARPSRRVMLLGGAFQLGIVALWALSRTVGVPIAPHAWVPEQIGVADLVATVGEVMGVVGVLCVALSPRSKLARLAMQRMAPLLLAVVLMGVLFGVSAHAG